MPGPKTPAHPRQSGRFDAAAIWADGRRRLLRWIFRRKVRRGPLKDVPFRTVKWFRRLAEAFRPTVDGVAQVMRPIDGSAAYPAPPVLTVPEDLKRAVDEENRRKAAEEREPESD